MKIAIFGAGKIGLQAFNDFKKKGNIIECFIDNSEEKQGKVIFDTPVMSLSDFLAKKFEQCHVVLAASYWYQQEMKKQLKDAGIFESSIYNYERDSKQERLISYSGKEEMEDVILYHVLQDVENIFYIDVGSNDPFNASVTKLLYDIKNASGINIEPQKKLIEITEKERPRDINLCIGIGKQRGTMNLFYQGGLSTIISKNVLSSDCYSESVEIYTLKHICKKYIKNGQEISFLKIDVEGAEKDVLEGADFCRYRPWIIIIESTYPMTHISNYNEWEPILVAAKYHFVQMVGVNRYYVANEKRKDLDEKFINVEELKNIYDIYHAEMSLI